MKENPSQTSVAEPITTAVQHHKLPRPIHRGLNLVGLLAAAVWLLAAAVAPAQTDAWSGASGSDQNWSTPGNWFGGLPGPTSNVLFQDDGATGTQGPGGTVDNTVNGNPVIQSLQYGNTNNNHNTLIPAGVTLTVSNAASATTLLAGTGTDNGAAQTVYATVQGAGTLFVTNTSGTIVVRQTSNTSGSHFATLDLSGLSNFTAYVSQVLVGQATTTGALNRPDGKLLLATNNTIVCSASSSTIGLLIADSTQNAGNLGNEVDLGQTNAIFTDGGITVARQKSTGTLKFNPNNAPGSSLLLRNKAGTGPMNLWTIGDNAIGSSGSGTGDSGTVDLTGGTVDAQVTTIYVGRGQTAGTGTGKGVGILKFSAGTIGAGTVEIGYQLAGGAAAATGTLDVDGTAQLFVTNNLRVGYYISGSSSLPTGTLNIGSLIAGGTVTVTGQILEGGGGSDLVSLTGGTLSVGGIGSSTVPLNKLTLNNGTLNLNLTAAGNPATPVCNASTLNVNGAITLNLQGVGFTVGQFSLIKAYPGPIGGSAGANGFTLGSLPSRINGYLSNNTANASIDLVITNVATPKWNGLTNGVPIGNWDIAITPDWKPTTGSGAITYLQSSVPGDAVLFDDTATGTTTVNLTTTLSPAAITVSNAFKTYTFMGSGSLSGPGALVKQGSALLAITNSGSNGFAGAISLNDGTLQLGGSANELPVAAAVTLGASGSPVLDLNNQNQTLGSLSGGGGGAGTVTLGSATLTIGGGGGVYDGVVSGAGQVVMNGTGTQVFTAANLYTGGTLISTGTLVVANSSGSGIGPGTLLIGAGGTLQLGNGGPAGSVAVTTITNNGLLVFDRSDDLTFTTPIVGSGAVAQIGTDIVTLPIANAYTGGTFIDNGAVRATNPNALGAASGTVNIQSPASARLELAGGVTLPQPLYLLQKQAASAQAPAILNISDTNILAGPITATSGGQDWTFVSQAGKLVVAGSFTNIITGSSTRYLRLRGDGDGEWFSNIGDGPGGLAVVWLLRDSGAGTWTVWGTNTYSGSTLVSAGTLLINGVVSSPTVTVSGGTLGGTGLFTGPVTVNGGGTLEPGTATTIGTLTISNSLSLSAVTVMKVSHSACDQVVGLSSLSPGGTLEIVVLGQLAGGEVFKLFNSAAFSGGDFGYALPDIGPYLSWDPSSVPIDGTLRVAGAMPQIAQITQRSDHNFQLSGVGPDGVTYSVLATTNVSLPLADWTPVGSGTFTSGAFTFTDLNATNYLQRFYLLSVP